MSLHTKNRARTAVLAALDTQRKLAPEILDGLTGVAMKDEDSEAGWVAARTVGRVMAVDLGRGGDASPYLDRLLTIGARSPDAHRVARSTAPSTSRPARAGAASPR
jgi:hypothetical protein